MSAECFKNDKFLFNLMPGSVCLEECKDGLECLAYRYRKYIQENGNDKNKFKNTIEKLELKASSLSNPDSYTRARLSPTAIVALQHEARGIRYSVRLLKNMER